VATADQLPLFAPPPRPADSLNAALDRIGARFGRSAVTTADLTNAPAPRHAPTAVKPKR
jgi:hypothetical protein